MIPKKELKLLTELLNLEGVNVSSHRQYEGIGIILQVEAIDKESSCSHCGSKSNKLHLLGATQCWAGNPPSTEETSACRALPRRRRMHPQNRWQIIKDLSWG